MSSICCVGLQTTLYIRTAPETEFIVFYKTVVVCDCTVYLTTREEQIITREGAKYLEKVPNS